MSMYQESGFFEKGEKIPKNIDRKRRGKSHVKKKKKRDGK